MSDRRDLDRDLAAYLEGRSTSGVPASLLGDTLSRVETTRQRPRLLIAERWLPAAVTGPQGHRARTMVMVAILALLMLAAIALAIAIGSQRRLPAPFGIARPGRIAFDVGSHIYTANPDGTDRKQLTSGSSQDAGANWSPDGTRIAYASELDSDLSVDIVMMGADGGDPVHVAHQLLSVGDTSWSPDSRHITFSATPVGSQGYRVFVADLDHPDATQLGGPDVFGQGNPGWSPDGSRIVFKRIWPCCTPDALWTMKADGTDLRQLSGPTGDEANAGWNTAWSPDGRQLAYLADGVAGRLDVYIINADGTGQLDITKSPQDEYWPAWSPDGTRIAFPRMRLDLNNKGSFIVVKPDGSEPVELPGPLVNSNQAVWSPDGTQLIGYAVDSLGATNTALAVFDASGRVPSTTIPVNGYNSATWQRLAP